MAETGIAIRPLWVDDSKGWRDVGGHFMVIGDDHINIFPDGSFDGIMAIGSRNPL